MVDPADIPALRLALEQNNVSRIAGFWMLPRILPFLRSYAFSVMLNNGGISFVAQLYYGKKKIILVIMYVVNFLR